MAATKYSQDQLTRAILLVIEQGLSPTEASKITGISKRTIQRYKIKYVDDLPSFQEVKNEVAIRSEDTVQSAVAVEQLDEAFVARAQFLKDLIATKQTVLDRINKVAKKSDNLDALQRTVKTLTELESAVQPDGAGKHPDTVIGTVNVFQNINQKLINQGYEGPNIEDADIVTGN